MSGPLLPISAMLLVDRDGRLLLQLRDGDGPHPHLWCLPGGHGEAGESPVETVVRELHEETGLRPDTDPLPFATQELPAMERVMHYFCAATNAAQDDVVLGEGAAMLFVAPEEILARPFTPGTAETLAAFLASPEYARLRER
jgi:8-oxo-dGTP diphosphatase